MPSGRCLAVLETPREDRVTGVDIALNCLALQADTAVSGSNEGVVRVWDVRGAGRYTARLDCSEFGAVNALLLTAEWMVSGHDEGQVWNRIKCRFGCLTGF